MAKMEDRRGQYRIGPTFPYPLHKVVQVTYPPASNERNRDHSVNCPEHLDIEPITGTVTIHRCEKDLASTPSHDCDCPLDQIETS